MQFDSSNMDDAYLSSIADDLGNQIQKRFKVSSVQSFENENKTAWMKNEVNVRNTSWYRCRRPSLHSRLQDGRNLQLCFLNQQSSEMEDNQLEDGSLSLPNFKSDYPNAIPLSVHIPEMPRNTISCSSANIDFSIVEGRNDTNNNELQNEIFPSLKTIYAGSNRKMESNHRQRSDSPITCTIKSSLKKIGANDGNDSNGRRRMSRQMLTKMNSYQLQTIINDLHAHVEYLNEQLMKMLMERDELHMSRDSLLVDIEDITAYLDAKQVYKKSALKNCISNANYINKGNIHKTMMSSTCAKNLKFDLRFNRLTSYIRN